MALRNRKKTRFYTILFYTSNSAKNLISFKNKWDTTTQRKPSLIPVQHFVASARIFNFIFLKNPRLQRRKTRIDYGSKLNRFYYPYELIGHELLRGKYFFSFTISRPITNLTSFNHSSIIQKLLEMISIAITSTNRTLTLYCYFFVKQY